VWKTKAWLQNDIIMYLEKAEGVIRGLDDQYSKYSTREVKTGKG